MRHLASVLFTCVFLAGCSGGRPEGSNSLAPVTPYGAVPLYNAAGQINHLAERATYLGGTYRLPNRRDRALEVLVLSGGGSNGAFGAGALVGWSQSGKRPSFDIVTGISTGALMAPFAFLGEAYDEQLRTLYTETSDAGVYTSRGPLGILQVSLNDTSPLRARLDEVITDELLDKIAAEHAKGRRLYVGTTDLDTGEAVTWDMGGIAASNKADRRTRFAHILLASAAVPGIFNPVFIEGGEGRGAHMHVDGGVKAPLLLRDFMLAGNYRTKRVYFIINSCMCLRNIKEPVDASFVAVTKKSIEEIMRSFLYRSLQTGIIMARNAGATPSIQFIPDEVTPPDALNFDPVAMRELFEVGRAAGNNPASWRSDTPRAQHFLSHRAVARRDSGLSTANDNSSLNFRAQRKPALETQAPSPPAASNATTSAVTSTSQ